jgi:hypothetical protein
MERLLRESGKKIEEISRKEREKKLRAERKSKILTQAVQTFGILTFDLAESGVDQQSYQTELEGKGLQPKPGETPGELLERAARICIRNGKSALEVAETLISNERVRPSRSLGDYRSDREELDKNSLAEEISAVYRSAMGFKK